ncbi:MAG: hypothetical protein ACOCTG_00300 [Bacteroidota bacterium]
MSQEVMNLQERIKAELEHTKNTIPTPSTNSISTKGKVFTFPDGQNHPGPMQAVVLDWRNFNRYYTRPYDPQNPAPPDCFALAKNLSDMAPHSEATDPQAETCKGCPMNEFGSAPNGRGKACRNTVRLAVAPPDADETFEPWLLNVAPTSLKSWTSFVSQLEAIGRIPLQAVAEIAFKADAAFPQLTFIAREFLDEEAVAKFWQLREKAQAQLDAPPSVD